MDESLNQSISVKKPSKKIKQKKAKFINLTIFLLFIHSLSIYIQKHLEHQNLESKDNVKLVKDIFLVAEYICIAIFIIIHLCKINNNLLILFSILYFIVGLVILFYYLLNIFCYIPEDQKLKDGGIIFFYLLNNVLFFIEGTLIFFCSDIIEKEKLIVNREKYGYKNDEYILHADKILKHNYEQ